MIYKPKRGARLAVPAQVIGEVCEEISSRGKLTPKALVDASRPEDAPLHKAFEWDNAKAAERYRETQASYLIRSIEVVRTETKQPVRAFVSVKNDVEDEPSEYQSIDVVMSDKQSRAALLAQAFSELAAIRRKYVGLAELADVFAAIDKATIAMDAAVA